MGELLTVNYEDYIIGADSYLSDAINKLCVNKHKGLVVVSDEKVVGVFTRRDMVNCSHIIGTRAIKITDFYNREFEFYTDQTPLTDRKLCHSIVPIVDNNKVLLGIYFPKKHCTAIGVSCQVVINAGGKGTRLYPYTKKVPKPLVEVLQGKTMIELVMDQFQKYGLDDFHIIVNYKKELMEEFFKQKRLQYNATLYHEDTPLGTGGGLSFLKDKINATFLFSNCDIMVTEDCCEMYEYHSASNKIATMLVSLKPVRIPYGVVQIDENQNLKSSVEKPTFINLVNTGIYILEPEIFHYINDEEEIGFPEVLERAIRDGKEVGVYPITADRWLDMGQIDELECARNILSKAEVQEK